MMRFRVGTLVLGCALMGCVQSAPIFEARIESGDASEEEDASAAADASELDANDVDASESDASDAAGERDAGDAGLAEPEAGRELDAGPAWPSFRSSAAFEHSCVSHDEGLSCWGRNSDGQLGIGPDHGPQFRPVKVVGGAPYTQLCAGEAHTCGLKPDGEIDCWGSNVYGQLGLGDNTARDLPTSLRTGLRFSALACGGRISCAISDGALMYCWGESGEGATGQDDPATAPNLLTPTKVATTVTFQQVSIGQGHVCAVATTGAIYCWGRNTNAQLGHSRDAVHVRVPIQVEGGGAYTHVTAGQAHSCAVRNDGRLFCWGYGLDGRLGLGAGKPEQVFVPTQVGNLSDYRQVIGSWFHTCALRQGGVLMCWGRNDEGQLGVGHNMLRQEPTRVGTQGDFGAFTVGRFHTCALRLGHVFCWGQNKEGQSGIGSALDRLSSPAPVYAP